MLFFVSDSQAALKIMLLLKKLITMKVKDQQILVALVLKAKFA